MATTDDNRSHGSLTETNVGLPSKVRGGAVARNCGRRVSCCTHFHVMEKRAQRRLGSLSSTSHWTTRVNRGPVRNGASHTNDPPGAQVLLSNVDIRHLFFQIGWRIS
jgi:hypothetical protein